mmetsp:Transcript_74959/g.124844  ORF Transcript_74959/g.124844 Transcript_74959/m.124844 type:complete len:89 (+) Transcript_74959:1022-1288(+)
MVHPSRDVASAGSKTISFDDFWKALIERLRMTSFVIIVSIHNPLMAYNFFEAIAVFMASVTTSIPPLCRNLVRCKETGHSYPRACELE